MNSEQPVEPIQSAESGEASPIVDAILARTRLMQRALTPWTRRWLSQAAGTAVPGRRDLSIAFTAGAAEQTLNRVQAQYRSYSSRPLSEDTRNLPLAGASPQPTMMPVVTEVSEARDDVQPVEDVKPVAMRTQGPYSKPFNSMAEFLKAVEAAKARDYAPPPPEEIAPPPPPREAGPYSHAFTSFEEFVKAVEESRRQSGYTAPQEDEPKLAPAPRGKIRPMSRVEELPTRDSSTLADLSGPTQSSTPQAVSQPAESFSSLDQSLLTPAAETKPPESDDAVSAESAPISATPQPAVIPPFSPVKARGGTGAKVSGPQPLSRKTVTASELPEPIESMPPASPTSSGVPPNELVSEAAESAVESGLPGVPQPTVEFAPSITLEAPPTHVPITPRPSTEPSPTRSTRSQPSQRSASEPGTPTALSGSTPAAPSAASAPAIQRAMEESAQDSSTPGEAESAPVKQAQRLTLESAALPIDQASLNPIEPSVNQGPVVTTASQVQRQVSESVIAPIPAQPESSAPTTLPVGQRQASEPSIPTVAPETVAKEMVEQSQADTALDLSLVQREPVEQKPKPTPTAPEQPTVTDKIVAPAQPQAVPSQPMVQRQTSERSTSTVVPETTAEEVTAQPETPARSDLPLVQRQTAEQPPTSADKTAVSSHIQAASTQPVAQRKVTEPPTSTVAPETATKEVIAQAAIAAASTPAQSALPLVQRQRAEKPPTTTAPQPVASDDKAAASPQSQVVSSQPVVQRQASEALASKVVPETATEEIAAQPVMPANAVPTRSDLPLVQRHTVEEKPIAIAPQPVTSADKGAASSSVQAVPDQPIVQRQASEPSTSTVVPETVAKEMADKSKAAASLDLPLAQRQTAEKPPTAIAPQPVASDDKTAASSHAQMVSSQTVVQRQTSERSVSTAVPETTAEEVTAQPVMPATLVPARSDLPPVQRQPDQGQRRVSEPPISIDRPHAVMDNEALVAPIGPEVAPSQLRRGGPPVQAVQREVAVAESTPPEWTGTSTSARNATPSARSEMPLVQRHAADVHPIEEGPTPVPDRAANISKRILARVASHETVPAARLPALPLHQPVVQRVSASEVIAAPQPVASQTVSIAPVMSAPAPVSMPVVQRTPEPVIQRMPIEPAAPASGSGLIQRVETAPAESSASPASLDLDTLARQVYPIIKHLLAVERDRRMSR